MLIPLFSTGSGENNKTPVFFLLQRACLVSFHLPLPRDTSTNFSVTAVPRPPVIVTLNGGSSGILKIFIFSRKVDYCECGWWIDGMFRVLF